MSRIRSAAVLTLKWIPLLAVGGLLQLSSGCAAGGDGDPVVPPIDAGNSCQDRCEPGVSVCVSGGYQDCVATNGCYDFGPVNPCPPGTTCQAGACQQGGGCVSECTEGSAQCTATGIQTCNLDTGTGCWMWGADTPCPTGETCSAGKCSSECTDECTTDSRECDSNGWKECGNFDADPCLDWGPVNPCNPQETCADGYCESSCTNECTANAVECVGAAGTHSCGNFDADTCLEWSPIQPCSGTDTCANGQCGSTCVDECPSVGAKQCTASGNAFQTCADSGGCLAWGLPTSCGQDESCENGDCVGPCDCDFFPGVCEPDQPDSTTACACDADCAGGGSPCVADGQCDPWCPDGVDPDCSCACDYNEYCEADAPGSTGTCSCDPDCEVNEEACEDDGHCDSWCPTGADPDCGVDPCRARWMMVGFREADQMFLSGAYENPDSDEGAPWVQLSPGLSSGYAEALMEFASENVSCVDSISIWAWGYDDSLFGDGAEMYFYNWDTAQYDLLPDQTIGFAEGYYFNTVLDPSPYILCAGNYCYIASMIGASSWDQTHLWDMDVSVYMTP